MNGKPKSWAALMKSVQLAPLSAMPSRKRRAQLVDKLILNCLATAASDTGAGARPGNDALMATAGVGFSQLHAHIVLLEKAGLIRRTETGDGRGNASVYRICFENPAFPEHTPNLREWFIIRPDDGPEKPSGLQPDSFNEEPSGYVPDSLVAEKSTNPPVSEAKLSGYEEKPSGYEAKLSGSRPEHIPVSTKEHPSIPPAKSGDGWNSFFKGIAANASLRMARMTKKQEAAMRALVDARGGELTASAVRMFHQRNCGSDGVQAVYHHFLKNPEPWLEEAYRQTPEYEKAVEEATLALARKNNPRAFQRYDPEAEEKSFKETEAMLKKLCE